MTTIEKVVKVCGGAISIIWSTFFMIGCSVQGELLQSFGLIEGWEEKEGQSQWEGLKISVVAHNAYSLSSREKLLGVTLREEPSDGARAIGGKPFRVEVRARAAAGGYFLSGMPVLRVEGEVLKPSKVFYGLGSIAVDCYSDYFRQDSIFELYEVEGSGLDSDSYTCLALEFNIATPSPKNSFVLDGHIIVDDEVFPMLVGFQPRSIEFYYN